MYKNKHLPEMAFELECGGCKPLMCSDDCHNALGVLNATPHDINIVRDAEFNKELRKWVSGEIVSTIPKSGVVLNATISTKEAARTSWLPIFTKEVTGCDPLPPGYDIYIVSAIYADAYVKQYGSNEKLYTVADPVMSDDGRTFRGCRGLIKYCQ